MVKDWVLLTYRQAMRGFLSLWFLEGLTLLMTFQVWRGVVTVNAKVMTPIGTESWDSTDLKPWTQEEDDLDQHDHKGSSNLCSDSKYPGQEGGGLLKRLVGSRFHGRETIDKSHLLLVPWIEPFAESSNIVKKKATLKKVRSGRISIGPSKRGWELVDMCQCCYRHLNSPCCDLCQRGSGINTNRHISKERKPKPKPKPKYERKHTKNFIQTTMCLCCDRANVDTCCELCERVETLWCC